MAVVQYARHANLRYCLGLLVWLVATAAVLSQIPQDLHRPTDVPGIERLMRVADRIYSGGEPAGDEGFRTLQKLKIKTIVSVDGARPDVERARQYGIRYVHIPVGYDGITAAAAASLTRVVREVDGPIFIHCHHGQHRGPAAAAIACRAAGLLDAQGAEDILKRAGTSRDYAGLWRDVRQFVPPPLDAPLPPLHEVAPVSSLASLMAQLDRDFDLLKRVRQSDWKTPPDHPDVTATRQALLVEESLREATRLLAQPSPPTYPPPFAQWLEQSHQAARSLRAALAADRFDEASHVFQQLEQSCKQCHRRFRD
jgi:protein tyrosine phosphatase (PTP) superfamily phosphohydrolase (DUF442 family)